ncbi:MAG TPA: hypothetical protein VK722_02685 [Candidatus Aquilonibacter sp.]|jgi:hypothetical protein|nr:hypothetical protein [Candidatus Aquilonibacter sp.]
MTKADEHLLLVEKAGFIFRGRVVRHGTTDTQFTASAPEKIVTVQIEEIFNSTEVLRGLAGKEAIVISDLAAGMKEGNTLILFTNCVSLGNSLVLRELAQLQASRENEREVMQAVNTRNEQPLRNRVEKADLIITGRVIDSQSAGTTSILKSEHDPDWWIARVAVQSVLKGKETKKEIEVLFPNSTDIVWYKVPKLREGMRGIFLLQHLREKESPKEVARAIYQITDPLDFLPGDRLNDVQNMLESEKGGR